MKQRSMGHQQQIECRGSWEWEGRVENRERGEGERKGGMGEMGEMGEVVCFIVYGIRSE